jgi:hypothetical protein
MKRLKGFSANGRRTSRWEKNKQMGEEQADGRRTSRWEKNKQMGEMVLDMMHEGLFVGQVCNSMAVQKKALIVNFDDGKGEKYGVVSYSILYAMFSGEDLCNKQCICRCVSIEPSMRHQVGASFCFDRCWTDL